MDLRWAILNDILRNIPQLIQAHAGILHYVRSQLLLSVFLSVLYSMLIILFEAMCPLQMKLTLRFASNKRSDINML